MDTLYARLTAAAAARAQGRRAEEIALLDEALQMAPDNPQAQNARGMRALADADHAMARSCFAAAAAADPDEPALWMNLATANRALADHQGERQSLERVLSIDRLHFMAQLRMAELNERTGEMGRAAMGWSAVVQMALSMEDKPAGILDALERGQAFLLAHKAGLADALDAKLGDMTSGGEEARRFNACLDHVLGRRRIFVNECAGVHFPFLPADEFFPRAHFPWLAAVEARTAAIRGEMLQLISAGGAAIRPYVRQDAGTPDNKWSPLDHSLDWSACFLWEYGAPNPAVCDACPETAATLATLPQNHIPGNAPSAFFSILKPHTRIPPHTGVTNTRAIVHLPLVVPDGCGFRVGGETRQWKVGEAFVFDDTIEHEAWNDSDEARIILIFDVWNPHLTLAEQDMLKAFFEVSEARKSAGLIARPEGRRRR